MKITHYPNDTQSLRRIDYEEKEMPTVELALLVEFIEMITTFGPKTSYAFTTRTLIFIKRAVEKRINELATSHDYEPK